MLRTQKSTFLNSDFFAKSEIQNIITISKIMKLVQKLNSQQQIEHGGHFYCRHGYFTEKYLHASSYTNSTIKNGLKSFTFPR